MNVVAFAPPPDPTVSVALDVLRDFQDLLAARAAGATAPEGSSLRDGMVRMAAGGAAAPSRLRRPRGARREAAPVSGPRLPCAVRGCGESRGLRRQDRGVLPAAWICGACWDLVPEAMGAEYRHLQRRERREVDRHGVPPADLAARADIAFARCAAAAGFRCEAAACEAASCEAA